MTTFEHFDSLLTGRRVSSRKLANNTYARRRGEDAIAVQFHDTDVVTYYRDGLVMLNTGGWHTVTTKARMNEFGPRWLNVASDRGRWYISVQPHVRWPDKTDGIPYADAMTLKAAGDGMSGVVLDGAKDAVAASTEDAANDRMRKEVNNWLRTITAERIVTALSDISGDCWFCSMRTAAGTPWGDIGSNYEHLREHIREDYLVGSMIVNAVRARNFGNPDAVISRIYSLALQGQVSDLFKDSVRKYLHTRLSVGNVAVKS